MTEIVDAKKLLEKCIENDFPLETVSMVCEIPQSELQNILNDKPYDLDAGDKESLRKYTYLMVFLMQLHMTTPTSDSFFPDLTGSITDYFHVPRPAIAKQVGVLLEELEQYLDAPAQAANRREIELGIMHLFTTLVRNPRFSG